MSLLFNFIYSYFLEIKDSSYKLESIAIKRFLIHSDNRNKEKWGYRKLLEG